MANWIPSITEPGGGAGSPYEWSCAVRTPGTRSNGTDPGDLAPLSEVATADTVIVPGVEDPPGRRTERLLVSLRSAHAAGARMVSFCGGAFVPGAAGVLDGRRATTHWMFAEESRRAFPAATLEAEHLYVDDGPVHTSRRMLTCVDSRCTC